ncbi:MAG: hypothetical protein B6243_04470 [Anaerolineaceae bacterium 4572_5.2]|nr:MAG: hypothetical protein B6243_04470 [Anaerolineaceae bacterium 4572_5.2]
MNELRKLQAPAVIIGGGIVGSSVAYHLARRGARVALLEKNTIGAEASARNAGGVRAQCRRGIERRLAMASINLWEGMEAEMGVDMEYTQGGNIRLAADETRMAQLQAQAEAEWADGLQVEVWNRDELRRRAPTGALKIETPLLIHAAGVDTPQLQQSLGLHIPVKPARISIALTQPMPSFFTEFVSTHDYGLYFRPARKGHIHIGAIGRSDERFDKTVPEKALPILAKAARLVPKLRHASFLRSWGGVLAMTPDSLPIIGPVEGLKGYLLATGFSGHGFCLGPIAGKLLSEVILDGESSIALDELSLARFEGAR